MPANGRRTWLPELSRRRWIAGSRRSRRPVQYPDAVPTPALGPALGFHPCRPSLVESLRRRRSTKPTGCGRSLRIGNACATTPGVANVRAGGGGGSWPPRGEPGRPRRSSLAFCFGVFSFGGRSREPLLPYLSRHVGPHVPARHAWMLKRPAWVGDCICCRRRLPLLCYLSCCFSRNRCKWLEETGFPTPRQTMPSVNLHGRCKGAPAHHVDGRGT